MEEVTISQSQVINSTCQESMNWTNSRVPKIIEIKPPKNVELRDMQVKQRMKENEEEMWENITCL